MSDTPDRTQNPGDAAKDAPKSGGIDAPVKQVEQAVATLTTEKQGEGGPLTEDDKTWGLLAHLSALSSLIGVPFGSIIGPLIVYLIKKDQSRFVHFHALQSLIFQIIFSVAAIVIMVPLIILGVLSGGLLFIPIFALAGLVSLAMLIYVIIMGVKAKDGKWVMYSIAGNIAYEKLNKTAAQQ